MFRKKKNVLDDVTQGSEWYIGSQGADTVKARLAGQPDGRFVVRDSASQPGNFVLSYTFEGAVKNVHIDGEGGVAKLARSTLTFKTLSELIRHYADGESGELQAQLTGATFASADEVKELKRQQKQATRTARTYSVGKSLRGGKKKGGGGGRGSVWKVQDVCDWLKSAMEMAEYVPTFKKNKIDGEALLLLDDAGLKNLGVGSVGQRKKLVTAIENLNIKFKAMEEKQQNAAEPQGASVAPNSPSETVTTIGLVARNIEGKVKIFDIETGKEVIDIPGHQAAKRRQMEAARAGGDAAVVAPPAPKAPEFKINEHEEKMWYDRNLAKARIQPLLEAEPDGSFVVRDSSSNPGCYAFSYIAEGKVQHKLIEESDAGFHFKACEEVFATVCNLIYHYTMTPGLALKCCLIYPTNRIKQVGGFAENAPAAVAPAAGAAQPPHPAKQTLSRSWDAMQLPKAAALAKVDKQQPGTFVIRASDKAYAAITVVRPDGSLYHQHIMEVAGGLQLKKSEVVVPDLDAFVTHFAQPTQTDLPCPLIVL